MKQSKKLYSQMIASALVVSAVVAPAASAEEVEAAASAELTGEITAINNVTTKDIVKVKGVQAGDIIKVYSSADATEGTLIGQATARATSVEVAIPKKFPADATKVYVTRTEKGKAESPAKPVDVPAEAKSEVLEDEKIKIENNVKTADTVTVSGVKSKEVIKVYSDAEKKNLIGKAVATGTKVTVKISKKFATKEAALETPEKIYVTRTSTNKLESDSQVKTKATEGAAAVPSELVVPTELKTTFPASLKGNKTAGNEFEHIVVKNNALKADTVTITGLEPKDEVILYSDAEKTTVLGKAVAKKGQSSLEIKVKGDLEELFKKDDASGYNDLYVTIKRGEHHESTPQAVAVTPETQSSKLAAPAEITTQNTLKKDTLTVEKLNEKDIINVYALTEITEVANETPEARTARLESQAKKEIADGDATLLGTAKAKKDGKAVVTIRGGFIPNGADFDDVFVTVTKDGETESEAVLKAVDGEPSADDLVDTNITIQNNVVTKDSVTVKNLITGDIVYVYADAAKTQLLGQAKASKTGEVTIAMKNQNVFADLVAASDNKKYIYVSRKSAIAGESGTIQVEVVDETSSALTLETSDIVVTNNTKSKDVVVVTNASLKEKDVVTVYDKENPPTVIGKGVVKKGETAVTISLTKQLDKDDEIDVAVTQYDRLEGAKTTQTVGAVAASTPIGAGQLTTENNVTKKDVVKVTGLKEGDVVKVYDTATAGTVIGTATVAKGKTEVEVALTKEFTKTASAWNDVWVTVTSTDKAESARTSVKPADEEETEKTFTATAENNVTKKDIVKVTGVKEKDVVKVYDKDPAEAGANVLATATVGKGKEEIEITITSKFPTEGTKVYVTVTADNATPSEALEVIVAAETKTTAVSDADITLINNVALKDAVKVTNVAAGNIVKVYKNTGTDVAPVYKEIGTATVAAGKTEVEIALKENFTKTDASWNKVFVTVTADNKLESEKVGKVPGNETQTVIPSGANFTPINNLTAKDVIKATSLKAGDIVKVYDKDPATTGAKVIGTATVAKEQTEATVTLTKNFTKTNDTWDKVWVTVTSSNELESAGKDIQPVDESKTEITEAMTISTVNNVATSLKDAVKVAGLATGDVVKVYKKVTKDSVVTYEDLGTATVAAGKTEVEIALKENFGFTLDEENKEVWTEVYVTVTSPNKLESEKEAVTPVAETVTTDGLDISQVTTTNAVALASDTVKVTGLQAKNTVNVYNKAPGTVGAEVIGTATVADGKTEVTITLTKDFVYAQNVWEQIYVTVAEYNKRESEAIAVTPVAEAITPTLKKANVTSLNPVNVTDAVKDTVKVTNLAVGDIVNVYDKLPGTEGAKVIGTATVATGATEATVQLTKTFTSSIQREVEVWDDVYVTVTTANKKESEALALTPVAESTTLKLTNAQVVATNNTDGAKDKIKVTSSSLVAGDIIKVYHSANDKFPQVVEVTSENVTAGSVEFELVKHFTSNADGAMNPIEITHQTGDSRESARLSVTPPKETITAKLDRTKIELKNNVTTADQIIIKDTNVKANEIVKVYADETFKVLLAEVTVTADVTTDAPLTITLEKQFAETVKGSNDFAPIYVTKKAANQQESEAAIVTPKREQLTPNLKGIVAQVANNVTTADTVTLKTLTFPAGIQITPTDFTEGAKVKVYDAAKEGNLLGEATVAAADVDNKEVTVALNKQLAANVEKVYVEYQVGDARGTEERLEATVGTQIDAKNFEVTNYVTGADVIEITGGTYKMGDTIAIYKEDGTTLLGEYTVTNAGGKTATSSDKLIITLDALLPENATTVLATIYNDMLDTKAGEKVAVAFKDELVSRVLLKSELKLYTEKLELTVNDDTLVQPGDKVEVYKKVGNVTTSKGEILITDVHKTAGKADLTFASELDEGTYELKLTQQVAADKAKTSDALEIDIEPTMPITGATLKSDYTGFVLKGAKVGKYELTEADGITVVKDGTFTAENVGDITLEDAIDEAGTYKLFLKEPHKTRSEAFTITVAETPVTSAIADTGLKFITVAGTEVGTTVTVTSSGGAIAGSFSGGKFTVANNGTLTAGTEYTLTFTKAGYLPKEIKVKP